MGSRRRRFLVPEVIQSSAMDCGPAALKSYLEGHGISLSYGRLREACQTEVDGTAIETLEELAGSLGAPVEQVLLPVEAVLLEAAHALPAIAVFRLPNGSAHFAVIWSVIGGVVQVMDPAQGRRWLSREALLEELYEHEMTVPAGDYARWASSDEGQALSALWLARPAPGDRVILRGAVLLRPARESTSSAPPASIAAARDEAPVRPLRELWGRVRRDGILDPVLLLLTAVLSAAAVVFEGWFFREFLERPALLGPLLLFLVAALVVDASSFTGELRLGRRLERGLRSAFLQKLPRLADRYFGSRLVSDMAERMHGVHLLRKAPRLARQIVREAMELVATSAAILWLAPSTAPLVGVALLAAIAVPLLGKTVLAERDARVRSHVGALSRFYLDALLGLVPLRVHRAEPAIRSEHGGILDSWAHARRALQRAAIGVETVQFSLGYGLVVFLVFSHLRSGAGAASALLLAYWALNLPVLGLQLARLLARYPEPRNTYLRIAELLGAAEEIDAAPKGGVSAETSAPGPSAIRFEDVTVRVSGRALLESIELGIEPGEHVAVVGPSGAGKTTLLSILLGFHFPDRGRALVDGEVLSGERLAGIRARTAWVDPTVQLWNRSLDENLRYGNGAIDTEAIRTELGLPRTNGARLGEGGGLLSGGEGQRVRLARAMLRKDVRLALLDEPFRGLDRATRADLLRRSRAHWKNATLLAVTHDVSECEEFDRVLVIERGRLVEDGAPRDLLGRSGSRFRRLFEAERELERLWGDGSWRSWRIRNGELVDAR